MVAVALALAGCGGGPTRTKIVHGTGYTFSTPASWTVVRAPRQVQAVEGKHSLALVAVSRLPLLHAFRPELWPKVVPELDRAAHGIADQQHGAVTVSKEVTIGGEQARRYDVDYVLRGKAFVETIGFVLREKTEYLLLCRRERSKSSSACDLLFSSFSLTSA